MKAVICNAYGPPEVLALADIAKPVPAANEILVRIHATTVTSRDCRLRSFDVPPMFWLPGRLGLGLTRPRNPILGAELAGEVEAVGSAVTRFKVGDAVFALPGHNGGTYAEYCCLPEDDDVALKPVNMTYVQAAGILFGGLTALVFLRSGQIAPGQTVLIYGASGAVGTYAVQLAHHFGAEVTAVCSGRNAELVRGLGADHVIDYTQEDFRRNGQRYDIIFDAVGKTTFAHCRDSLKDRGYYLHAVMVLADVKARWFGLTTGITVIGGTPPILPDTITQLKDLVEAGAIRPVIDRTYPLEQIVEAHRYVDTGRKQGNLVITVT